MAELFGDLTKKDSDKDEYTQFYNEIDRKYQEILILKENVSDVISALKEQQGYEEISNIKTALEDALNEMEDVSNIMKTAANDLCTSKGFFAS